VVFCLETLEEALGMGCPEIFNSDQGSQFTSEDFTGRLEAAGIQISMDGRGRVVDNIFVERLWRSVKYEEVYLKDYQDGKEAFEGLDGYFCFYNGERPHQALDYRTPREVHLT
jgi:putative transposase